MSYRKFGLRNMIVMSDLRKEVEVRQVHAHALKICNITLIYGRIAKIPVFHKKSGPRNMM